MGWIKKSERTEQEILQDAPKLEQMDPKQLQMGKEVEKEHKRTVEKIKEYLERTGKLLPEDEIYASIAEDHLILEIPDYYTRLSKMEEEAKREKNNVPIFT